MRYRVVYLFAALVLLTGCEYVSYKVFIRLGGNEYITRDSFKSTSKSEFWLKRAWENFPYIEEKRPDTQFAIYNTNNALKQAWINDSKNWRIYWTWAMLWKIQGVWYSRNINDKISSFEMSEKFFKKASALSPKRDLIYLLDFFDLCNELGFAYIKGGYVDKGNKLLQTTHQNLLDLLQNENLNKRIQVLLERNAFYRGVKCEVQKQ